MGGRGALRVKLLGLQSEHWRIGLEEKSTIIYLLKRGKQDRIKLTRIVSKISSQKIPMHILGKLLKNLEPRFLLFSMPAEGIKSL